MEVWIVKYFPPVFYPVPNQGYVVVGIFSTEEKAKELAKTESLFCVEKWTVSQIFNSYNQQ